MVKDEMGVFLEHVAGRGASQALGRVAREEASSTCCELMRLRLWGTTMDNKNLLKDAITAFNLPATRAAGFCR